MKKILLIGGSTENRQQLKTHLELAGHKVSAAVTRKYTNRWLGHRIKPFDLIIYNLEEAAQPDDFWPELRTNAGLTPLLLLADATDQTDWYARGLNCVMRSPFNLTDIVQTANDLLN